MVRRDCWEELGGFDERFFLYHEDWDLCRRARSAGWGVLVAPAAQAIHDLGGSAFQDRAHFWRRYHQSRDAFIGKHFGGWRLPVARAVHRQGLRLHSVAALAAGRRDEARHLSAALRALKA
jgi:GT2 family glycosyltransferase